LVSTPSTCSAQASKPLLSANKVASHLIPVTKPAADKVLERKVHDGWCQACRNFAMDPCLQAFSPGKVASALGLLKLGTTPGYDLIHSEFLKHLGPKVLAWLADLFTRMVWEHRISKIWRIAKAVTMLWLWPKLAKTHISLQIISPYHC